MSLEQMKRPTADAARKELPPELAEIALKIPQQPGEGIASYAWRLHEAQPQLTVDQLALLSGVTDYAVRTTLHLLSE
ncbi:hypothetical protein [Ensifer adhaerens]